MVREDRKIVGERVKRWEADGYGGFWEIVVLIDVCERVEDMKI